ncbi:MAG TPA: hypothetical protein VIM98_07675 [Dyella sp.]|uniref:hypothetical protein n=1 Tax=Dyella sp. TaxID=1869338 RepID=UPI002F93DFA8
MNLLRPLVSGLILCIAAPCALAADDVVRWHAVSDAQLDRMRGGFDLGSGIVASLGIDRAVYINGNLVTSTRFNIPDIGRLDATQASAVAAAMGTVNLVQNGPGNSFDPSAFSQSGGATVIQNTLNNQQIQALTTLNVSTNTLGLFRDMGLQESLQSALIRSQGH